jgi:2-polyprenyl-3-methyl-5-hydroxy-6-metoxy-1,4-benzoquinol methylase
LKNEWDEYADSWELNSSVQKFADNAFDTLINIIDIDGLLVLDFGCGTGALTQRLSPKAKHIVALDGSKEMIKALDNKKLPNVSSVSEFLTQDLTDNNPPLNNKFDLIVASSVCGFLPSYEETLTLLTSLLKPNGLFIQWDWLAENEASSIGLTENRVLNALKHQPLIDIQISLPFAMDSQSGKMNVLMATAQKTE